MDRLTSTTKFIDAKTDIRDRISVEVGDSKEAEFMPQTKVMRWNNEVNLSVRLVHDETRVTVEEVDGLVKWRGERREAHFYELPASELLPEGGTEVEILLLERPLTNVVRFTLNTKGLAFYKQELTENLRSLGVERLADNIDGSYAVYADTPKTNYTDGKLYRTGKVGHIYRPWIVDANGNGVWGNLNIDTVRGLLTVRIPQAFLDSAAYPVRHAAGLTFGYTTAGSVWYATNSNTIMFQSGTAASNGVIDSYSFYTETPRFGYNNPAARLALYSDDVATVVDEAGEFTTPGTYGPAWYDVNSDTNASVIAATDYQIGIWSDNGVDDIGVFVAYDNGTPTATYHAATYGTATAWPEPASMTTLGDILLSMYVTYTATAGAVLMPPSRRMQQYLVR